MEIVTAVKFPERNSDNALVATDYSTERTKLRSRLETNGKILSPDNEFTRLIKRVSEKLGVPDQTDVVVLDTEETNAFFSLPAKTTVFNRGLANDLLYELRKRGLSLSEDHIAAVLAHELEHAEVLGEDYAGKIEHGVSLPERLMRFQNHAEEYRADAEAMSRLSKAGYNPKALIDVLKVFGLTSGRSDSAHPEQIDRIRKLEDTLADDEHPLPHTTKRLTPLDESLITWIGQESTVYGRTDKLLHCSPTELAQALAIVESQQQFWDVYNLKENVERIAAAKVLLRQESQNLMRLAVKLMVYEACHDDSKTHFVDGHPARISREFNSGDFQREDYDGLSKENYRKISDIRRSFSGLGAMEYLFKGKVYRDSVMTEIPAGLPLDRTVSEMAVLEQQVDTAISSQLDELAAQARSQQARTHYAKMADCYRTGQVSSDLLLTLYHNLDLKYQTNLQQQADRRKQDSGQRTSEGNTGFLIDLSDPGKQSEVLEQIKFALAEFLIKPQASKQDINILSRAMNHDTGLTDRETGILTTTILKKEDARAWIEYLQTQDKDSLRRIIWGVKSLGDWESKLFFSPIRPFHRSYLACERRKFDDFAAGYEYGVDTSGFKSLRMLAGRVFYLKGYPPGAGYRPPPGEINLTMEEWNMAVEAQSSYDVGEERDEWALVKYLENVKDPKLTEYARRYAEVCPIMHGHRKTNLAAGQIQTMIDCSLWDQDKLGIMVAKAIDNWIEARTPPKKEEDFWEDWKLPALSVQNRKEIMPVLKSAYKIYETEQPGRAYIGSLLLDILIQDITSTGASAKEAVLQALKQMAQEEIFVNYRSIRKDAVAGIADFSAADIDGLLNLLKNSSSSDADKTDMIENFEMLGLIVLTSSHEPHAYSINSARKPMDAYNLILERYGDKAVEWVIGNFRRSDLKDAILIGLYENASPDQKQAFEREMQGNLTANPDSYGARPSAIFNFLRNDISSGSYVTQGRMGRNFPDLLNRRHPFAVLACHGNYDISNFIYDGKWVRGFDGERIYISPKGSEKGSPYQYYLAQRLLRNEAAIFNRETDFEQRMQSLTAAAPNVSVVRDIYLEMLLLDELEQAPRDEDRVKAGRTLLPLFTEKSSLKGPLSIQVFKAELAVNPAILKEFNGFIGLLTKYMHEPSLARNYFLNRFENTNSLTVDQLKQLGSLRLSSEGKKARDDSAPMTFLLDRLGELNREEKVKAVLWILGMSAEKPKPVLKMEHDFSGHLNNLPAAVFATVDDEKEVILKRFLLGAEGIVDLEAVKPDQLEAANAQRRRFIQVLSEHLLPDSMPRVGLFRDIFITIIESSDPAHAARILTKLINRFTEAGAQGKTFPSEEVIALGLNELGVIGKKVSQSLAEQDWVPESYKKTLRRSQSEGEIVPKRALLVMAEDAGLLDENGPIRIISFDQLPGSASNKQACFLTIEVSDESIGLSKGVHQVIGKFKRPSAQKRENIEHDLRVMRRIIEVLNQRGFAESLPRDFSAQISDAVGKELDFPEEKQFNEQLKADLAKRNAKRKQQILIPEIYFASEDVIIESIAPGISLRAYRNLREQGFDKLIASGYSALSEIVLNRGIVSEALAQLISTGNLHADLHPGNIFVDQQGKITFIDLGMNQRLNQHQRFATISLVAGLALGNEAYLKTTLKNMGWDLGNNALGLTRFNFAENTMRLLRVSQKASTQPPQVLTSVILAASKLSTHTRGLSSSELFRMLVNALNKQEAPKILAHLVRPGL